jgi:hypothetical protein
VYSTTRNRQGPNADITTNVAQPTVSTVNAHRQLQQVITTNPTHAATLPTASRTNSKMRLETVSQTQRCVYAGIAILEGRTAHSFRETLGRRSISLLIKRGKRGIR